jgi:hypothetical protein
MPGFVGQNEGQENMKGDVGDIEGLDRQLGREKWGLLYLAVRSKM